MSASASAQYLTNKPIYVSTQSSAGSQSTYTWNLDGETKTGASASFLISTAGTYTLTLTTTAADGSESVVTRSIQVNDPESTDTSTSSSSTSTSTSSSTNANVSPNPNANLVGNPAQAEWGSGYGSALTNARDPRLISALGIYPDKRTGWQNTLIKTLVKSTAPQVLHYRYQIENKDGVVVSSQTTPTPTTNFNLSSLPAGNYKASVLVVTVDGQRSLYWKFFSLEYDQSPNQRASGFSAESKSYQLEIESSGGNNGKLGEMFYFNANITPHNEDRWTYQWEFSDGGINLEKNPAHAFKRAGYQEVKLRASNGRTVLNETFKVFINETKKQQSAPSSGQKPSLNTAGVLPSSGGDINTLFRFVGEGRDPGGKPLTYRWDFGDGHFSTRQTIVHRFEKAGNYRVKLTISNGEAFIEHYLNVNVVEQGYSHPLNDRRNEIDVLSAVLPRNLAPTPQPVAKIELPVIAESKERSLLDIVNEEIEENGVNTPFWSQLKTVQQSLQNQQPVEKIADPKQALSTWEKLSYITAQKVKKESDRQKKLELRNDLELVDQQKNLLRLWQFEQKLISAENSLAPDDPKQEKITQQKTLITRAKEINQQSAYQFIRVSPNDTLLLYGTSNFPPNMPVLFRWDLEDGRQIVGQNARLKYAKSGLYKITLSVSNGQQAVRSTIIVEVTGSKFDFKGL